MKEGDVTKGIRYSCTRRALKSGVVRDSEKKQKGGGRRKETRSLSANVHKKDWGREKNEPPFMPQYFGGVRIAENGRGGRKREREGGGGGRVLDNHRSSRGEREEETRKFCDVILSGRRDRTGKGGRARKKGRGEGTQPSTPFSVRTFNHP